MARQQQLRELHGRLVAARFELLGLELQLVEAAFALRLGKQLAKLAVAAVQVLARLHQALALARLARDEGVHGFERAAFAAHADLRVQALPHFAGLLKRLLQRRAARHERLLALHVQGVLRADVLRLVEQRASMAQGVFRLGKPHGGKLGPHGLALLLLLGQACFQLLLVLQHDPVPVLNALGALVAFPARFEQHDERGCGEHHRHQHQEKSQRGERQAGDLAAVHEQRDAREHEGNGQRHGKADLHALLTACADGIVLLVLGLEHRLVGSPGSCVVVACQVDGVLRLRLLNGKRFDAVAQMALLGGRDARQLFGMFALRKPMLAAQALLLSTQIGDLLLQVGFIRLGLLQRFAVRLQRLNGSVQVADLRQQLIALRLQLCELVVLALQALYTIGFGGDATAQLILLRFELHQRFLGRRGP